MNLRSQRQQELAFAAIVICLIPVLVLATEAAIRSNFLSFLLNEEVNEYPEFIQSVGVDDPEIPTLTLKPNSSFGHIRINNLGYRGPDIALPKPQDRVRIAVMGSSTVFGHALQEEDTLPAQITALLAAQNPACQIEYVSISGAVYGHADFAWHLRNVLAAAEFDHAIIIQSGPGYGVINEAKAASALSFPAFQQEEPMVVLPVVDRLRLFWRHWEQRWTREEARWLADERQKLDSLIPGIISTDTDALAQILDAVQDADVWYFNFHGLHAEKEDPLRQAWKKATMDTVAQRENAVFSEALSEVPRSRHNFYNQGHYTRQGVNTAADLITARMLETFPKQNQLCSR